MSVGRQTRRGHKPNFRIWMRLAAALLVAFPAILVSTALASLLIEHRQAERNHELIVAIQANQANRAMAALAAGANPNATDFEPPAITPQRLWTMLLDRLRHVPPRRSNRGSTALLLATEQEEHDVAMALLTRGANDFRARAGEDEVSLINLALNHQDDSLAWMLWEKGAASREDLAQLVVQAVEEDDAALVERLASQGAPMRGSTPYGFSPFFVAARTQNWRMMQRLLDLGATVNDRGDDMSYNSDISALSLAARRNDFKMARFLLARGADVNACGKYGGALFKTVENSNAKMMQLLLAHHADPNDGDYTSSVPCDLLPPPDNYIPYRNRAMRRPTRCLMLRLLLKAHANPNTERKGGTTLLGGFAEAGYLDLVEAILQASANVDYRNYRDGSTALMSAAAHGRLTIARYLLRHGASVNLRAYRDRYSEDLPGDTALDFAIKNGHGKVARLLRRWGARRAAELPAHVGRWYRKTGDERSHYPSVNPFLRLPSIDRICDHSNGSGTCDSVRNHLFAPQSS